MKVVPRTRYLFAMAVDAIGSGMYLPLSLLYFHRTTGAPLTRVGALLTTAAVIGLVSNPLTGILVDRLGARRVVIGGYLLRAAAFACYPLVHSELPLLVVVTVVALCDAAFSPSVQSFVAEISRGAERDRLIAAQRSLRNAGLGAGGLIAGAALALGDDAAYDAIVLVAAVTFAGAAALVRSIPGGDGAAARARPTGRGGYRQVLRNRPFLALTALNVPVALGYTVLNVGLPVYLTQVLGQPSSLIGVLYAVNTVGIAVLQIPVTRALLRVRRTRAVACGTAVFALSFAAFAGFSLLSAGAVLLTGVFAATAGFTLGELLHGATASALVTSAAPEATRGRHLAFYQLSWAIPIAVSPALLTALLAWSPTGMWLLLAAGAAVSTAGVLRLELRLPVSAVDPTAPADEPVARSSGASLGGGGRRPSA